MFFLEDSVKKVISLLAVIFCPLVLADNFASCVLDQIPDSQNDAATYAVMQLCHQKYPEAYNGISQGSGRGWFGYDSGAECAIKKSAKTTNNKAGGAIRVACNCLYDKAIMEFISCEEQRNTPRQ